MTLRGASGGSPPYSSEEDLTLSNNLELTGNLSVDGTFTFGDAATDNLAIAGYVTMTGNTTNAFTISGTSTRGIAITGNSTTAFATLTGTFGTVFSIGGTVTTGIAIGACTTGISMTGAVTTGISIAGNATDGLKISGGTVTDAIELGACTNAINVSGAVTKGLLIAGNATDGVYIGGGTVADAIEIGACTTAINISGATTTGISIVGNATDAIKIATGTITTALNVDVGNVDVATRIICSGAPATYTAPCLSVGVYGTPIVDTAVTDNIAFSVNMSTATNKTSADTSCMAAFIGVSNTAATTNNKIQGLLVSNSLGYNCYDAYAVQGHTTVGAGGVATQNANAHITGLSGKALLTGNVTQGWVSGVLAIVDGTGTVAGAGTRCDVIAAVCEATTTASTVDAMLYLCADQTVIAGISTTGTMTTGIKMASSSTTGIDMTGACTNYIQTSGTGAAVNSRVLKGALTVNNGAYTDGYGLVEAELTLTGTVTDMCSPLSSWVNMASVTTGANYICAQTNGLWSDTGGVLTNGIFVFGMRAQCLLQTNGGASGAKFYPFSIVNNTNVTTAMILCNDATSDLGETTISEGAATYVPLFIDNEGLRYVKVYKAS